MVFVVFRLLVWSLQAVLVDVRAVPGDVKSHQEKEALWLNYDCVCYPPWIAWMLLVSTVQKIVQAELIFRTAKNRTSPIWHVSIMFDDLWSSPWLSKCVVFFFTLLIADFAQSLAMLTLLGLQESFAQLHFGPNLGLKRLLGGSTKVTHTLQKSCGDPPSKTSVGTSLKKGH